MTDQNPLEAPLAAAKYLHDRAYSLLEDDALWSCKEYRYGLSLADGDAHVCSQVGDHRAHRCLCGYEWPAL